MLVHDGEHRIAAIVFAAARLDQADVRFMLEHGSGMICVALSESRAEYLQLPDMLTAADRKFTVSVDADQADSDTVSDRGRAETVRRLAAPDAKAENFIRPGHVFPVVCHEHGVLGQVDLAEAAFDLARLAGVPGQVAAFSRLGDAGGLAAPMTTRVELFAEDHGLASIDIAELARHRLRTEQLVRLVVETRLPTAVGVFDCQGWEGELDGTELMSLRVGDVAANGPVQVAIHPACQAGDVFGSTNCSCAARLEESLATLQDLGRGVLVYLRPSERLGFTECGATRVGPETYLAAAQILRALEVDEVGLINPSAAAEESLRSYGCAVVTGEGIA
ncbi:MAG: 3,4-dihydroxy-2-butanone-4-phosphate synthase [Actinobacteria bacterium]|nr:3,4-dihydroxy-2-butanone-4-phosphate synthase [Actinomycetota bacterium]